MEKVDPQGLGMTDGSRGDPGIVLAMMDSSPFPVAWASPEGKLEYCNRRFVSIFGCDIAEVPTIDLWFEKALPDRLYREMRLSRWKAAVEEAFATGEDIEPMEVRLACMGGTTRTMIVHTALVDHPHPHPLQRHHRHPPRAGRGTPPLPGEEGSHGMQPGPRPRHGRGSPAQASLPDHLRHRRLPDGLGRPGR